MRRYGRVRAHICECHACYRYPYTRADKKRERKLGKQQCAEEQ